MNENDLLKAALDFSSDGIIRYSCLREQTGRIHDFQIQFLNRPVERIMGRPASELVGQSARALFDHTMPPGLWDQAAAVVETGKPHTQTAPFTLGLSAQRWYTVRLHRHEDGVLMVFSDTTDLKNVTRHAEQQVSFINSVLEHSLNGIIYYEPVRNDAGVIIDFRATLWNPAALAMTRQSDADFRQGTLLERYQAWRTEGSGGNSVFQDFIKTVETGESWRREQYFSETDFYFDLSATKLGNGVVVALFDLTEARRIERERQRQSKLVESVLNGSLNGLIAYESVRDASGRLTDLRVIAANEAGARMQNCTVDALIGSTLTAMSGTALEPGLFERYARTVETGEAQRVESQYTKDGRESWVDSSVVQFGDGMLMTFFDITSMKQSEQALQKTIGELQRSNQNLERFAYVASHDLQEPLRKITAFGDMLQSQYGSSLGTQGIGLVQRMQTATQRMQALIKDLLSFSRVTTLTAPFKRIDLQAVVDGVLSDLETVIREKRAVLDVTSLPYLEGDASQLRQLFQNLLSNALKFGRPGDIPLIRIDCEVITGSAIQPMPGVTVALSDRTRSFFVITVSDNGIGFDEKYLDRIFTIFQRLHSRNEYPGTGIGLAVVQKVVENHKGYLNARSEPDKGAEFMIYLPDEPARPDVVLSL